MSGEAMDDSRLSLGPYWAHCAFPANATGSLNAFAGHSVSSKIELTNSLAVKNVLIRSVVDGARIGLWGCGFN